MTAAADHEDAARAAYRRIVRRVGALEAAAQAVRSAHLPGPDLTGEERDAIDTLARRFTAAAEALGHEVEAAEEALVAAEASVDAEEAA